MLPIVKKHLFMRKDVALAKVCLRKYLLPAPLDITDVLEKSMRFLTLDLKTEIITSESIFSWSLRETVVYKVLNSKAEIDSAFFLTLILIRLVTIGK